MTQHRPMPFRPGAPRVPSLREQAERIVRRLHAVTPDAPGTDRWRLADGSEIEQPFALSGRVGPGQDNAPGDVRRVQAALTRARYLPDTAEGPSGRFDRATALAIRDYQANNDLTLDGWMRPGGETNRHMAQTFGHPPPGPEPARPTPTAAAAPAAEGAAPAEPGIYIGGRHLFGDVNHAYWMRLDENGDRRVIGVGPKNDSLTNMAHGGPMVIENNMAIQKGSRDQYTDGDGPAQRGYQPMSVPHHQRDAAWNDAMAAAAWLERQTPAYSNIPRKLQNSNTFAAFVGHVLGSHAEGPNYAPAPTPLPDVQSRSLGGFLTGAGRVPVPGTPSHLPGFDEEQAHRWYLEYDKEKANKKKNDPERRRIGGDNPAMGERPRRFR
ncbi:MAG: peptidoglycan-binding protein [Alphaproteobacteria bacterium]|nr:peptidoglycan-binding protein [Alphaproteobacteria bacterium]